MTRNETSATGATNAVGAAGVTKDRLALAAVDAVERVPGVAFLRPGLADLVRASYASRDRRKSGVRVRPGGDAASWHIEVQFVARRTYRTLDVTRAVRDAVLGVTADLGEAGDTGRIRAAVTVTVTGLV
ncbi:Asp23/Gls24 family envelope stress response protein [Streptomyces sp. NBC_01511]|uniref:Asp23/Gls24 family envelope stress response protein n=1 Tax=Streptomyces sp. NBC_01511 TaxID=2903889 RepID=UPI0038673769